MSLNFLPQSEQILTLPAFLINLQICILFPVCVCRTEPEYYDIVETPIDLLKIQQKLKTDEYDDICQLTEDVQLLVNNAKAYYSVNSKYNIEQICLLFHYQAVCNIDIRCLEM